MDTKGPSGWRQPEQGSPQRAGAAQLGRKHGGEMRPEGKRQAHIALGTARNGGPLPRKDGVGLCREATSMAEGERWLGCLGRRRQRHNYTWVKAPTVVWDRVQRGTRDKKDDDGKIRWHVSHAQAGGRETFGLLAVKKHFPKHKAKRESTS
jgi:hypothetical protein